MILQQSILHNEDEKEQIRRDFDVFSIEELNNELRVQNNQELLRKVHDLFFDVKAEDQDLYYEELHSQMQDEYEEVASNYKAISNSYLKLIPQSDLQLAQNYTDQYPFLGIRKQLLLFQKKISLIANKIVTNTTFEIITIFIIIFNSVMLAMDDPTTEEQTDFANLMDQIFLIYYTIEAILKIIAQGLIWPKKAYLRETWNILDFSVIITAYLPYFVSSNSLNLNSLRSFRVLRPLRTISSIKSLRMILLALFASLAQLRDAAIVLIFFYTIFAIAGVQLFSGYLKRRCFSDIGITLTTSIEKDAFCTADSDCPTDYLCGKQTSNPQNDLINFDTFGWAFLQVFVITTLEGWAQIQEAVILTFSQFVIFYFLLVVIVGAFFLVNLTLAVIKLNFKPEKIEEELKLIQEDIEFYDYWELRRLGLYKVKRYKVDTTNYGVTPSKFASAYQIRRRSKKLNTVNFNNIENNHRVASRKNIAFKAIQQAKYYSKTINLKDKVKLQGIYGMGNIDKDQLAANSKFDPLQKQTDNYSISSKTNEQKNKSSENLTPSENNQEKQDKPLNKSKNQTISIQSKNGDQDENQKLDVPNQRKRKSTSQQFQNFVRSPSKYSKTVRIVNKQESVDLLSNTEFSSINLSELSEDQLDTRLQEIAVDLDQIRLEGTSQTLKENEFKEMKTLRKTDAKKMKDFLSSEQYDNQFDEKNLKLKSKLHNIQFYPIIKLEHEQYTSTEEVLETKYIRELQLQKQDQEHKFKTMSVKVQYCFKNSKQILYSQQSQKSVAKKLQTTQNLKQSKTKKFKIFHGLRRVKPILDDVHPIEDFLMMSELVDSETRREDDQEIIDVQSSQNPLMDTFDHSKRKKKNLLNLKQELTYQELQSYFNDSNDCIVDLNKNNTVIKEIEQNNKNIFLSYHEREAQRAVFYHDYYEIRKKDTLSNGIIQAISSIEDVLLVSDYTFFDQKFATQMNSVMKAMNYDDNAYFKWIKGFTGLLLVSQRNLYHLVQSSYFEGMMNLAVALNTLILGLDGLISEESNALLIQFNFTFTILFTIELGLKLMALGAINYMKDTMNIFDALIVCLSLVELFILGGSNGKSSLSAFRAVRIFRAFRVLRVTKLMKSLQFMGFLIKVLTNSFQSLMYILLLMIIFIFIFTLLGMSFFGGQLTYTPSRENFDNLQSSFLVVFQVLTLENWNSLLYELLLQPLSPVITMIYLVLWIMIGNYVFLNLFLAILLENFEEEYKVDKTGLESDLQMSKNHSTTQALPNSTLQHSGVNINNTQNQLINQPILRRRSQVKITFHHDEAIQKKKEPAFIYFSEQGICQSSLFIFSQQNQFRKIAYRIVKDTKFEGFILMLIFLTSMKLVLDTYIPTSGDLKFYSLQFDIGFAILFGLECILKIVAFGFAQEEASYLRESWNVLDFFIVIASFVDVSVSSINLSFVKILRLLRTLRPLRFITHNKSMKILVSALLQSINGIFNVGIVIILSWLMFAILGVSLMKNKLHYCNLNDNQTYYYGKDDCINKYQGVWDNRDINFDNVLQGMLTLFVLSTLEGWPDYMYYFIDADESGPIFDAQLQFSWYFVIFILFGAMLLINLFIGVILVNYHLAEEASRDQNLTQTQSDWLDLQKLIIHSNPNMAMFFPPDNSFRALFFKLIKNKYFDPFIMTIIVFNIITMGLAKEEASKQYDEILSYLNMSFTFVFILEAILKLIALGIIGYMRNSWNQFDFFVVCASILDLVLDFSGNSFVTFLKVGPQIARVFRVLRVTRLFRLVKQFQGLQKLIETALYSLPAMLNVTALLFLVFFIFSILGVFLFQDIRDGQVISESNNFQDFHHSFEILFQCSTGEDWHKIMFDTMRGGQEYNCVFFILFIIIQQYIMLNLFILIILDQYEINYFNSDNPLNKFQEFENIFVESWSKFAYQDKGMKMHGTSLVNLMFEMEQPLGYELNKRLQEDVQEWKNINPDNKDATQLDKFKQQLLVVAKKNVATQIMMMNIYSDSDGYVRYHQVLFAVLKNYLQKKLNINLTEIGAKKIQQKEDETRQKITKFDTSKQENLVNPIVQYLFVLMAFKAMKRYKCKKKLQQQKLAQLSIVGQEYFSDENSSNTSYDGNVEILSRKTRGSIVRVEPEYGQIKYMSVPNTMIYQNNLALNQQVVSESDNDQSSDNQSSDQDASKLKRLQTISQTIEGLKRRKSQKKTYKK
ncbi:unnamed protein product [Paramecium octaurelia]|uniref:Ion transport domain-containing protein n=1 Tax=Paramecium octaurelia TaxID=43137 RepID=A0A8S1YA28_PAROT|nr:unnamed protein product [Paramecium octaurelia]